MLRASHDGENVLCDCLHSADEEELFASDPCLSPLRLSCTPASVFPQSDRSSCLAGFFNLLTASLHLEEANDFNKSDSGSVSKTTWA